MPLSGSSQRQNTNTNQVQNSNTSGTVSGNTQNTYGFETAPDTPDIARLRNSQFEVDPGLSSQYSRQRQDLNKSFAQPLGAHLSPQVRDAQMRSGQERLGRDEATALRGGQFDANRLGFERDRTVAGMTAPQLVQRGSTTSGTTTGNTSQQGSPFMGALGGAQLGSQIGNWWNSSNAVNNNPITNGASTMGMAD